jgi:hypothetical protein
MPSWPGFARARASLARASASVARARATSLTQDAGSLGLEPSDWRRPCVCGAFRLPHLSTLTSHADAPFAACEGVFG